MHTGDAHKAFKSLTSKLKVGGSITAHLYGKGNLLYEWVDASLRQRTTKMSIEELQRFSDKAYKWRRFFEQVGLAQLTNIFVRLDPHPHCIFDWYAAPIATHHTYPEVRQWFQDLHLDVVATHEPLPPRSYAFIKRKLRPVYRAIAPGSVTIRGIRQPD
jgi:hypothetical protein